MKNAVNILGSIVAVLTVEVCSTNFEYYIPLKSLETLIIIMLSSNLRA